MGGSGDKEGVVMRREVKDARGGKGRISLALAGGGARGFAHAGVIHEFLHEGFQIVEVAGSSMGAIIGAYYAFHGRVDSLIQFAKGLTKRKTASFLDVTVPRHSLIKGRKLHALLKEWFGGARIEDARVPLAIVASRLRDGKPVIFRKGAVVDVLMASSAIPGLLPAVRLEGEYYVDGGVSLNVPVGALRKRSTTKVVVDLPALCHHPRFERQPTLTEVLSTIYAIRQSRIQPKIPKDVVLLTPGTGGMRQTLAFHKSEEFIQAGARVARRALASPPFVGQNRTHGSGGS